MEIKRIFGKDSQIKKEELETNDEEYEEVVLLKRAKIETKEESNEFKNPILDEQQSKVSKLNRVNAASFIVKKKSKVEVKGETKIHTEKTKPLISLCVYSDDDDSCNDS